MRAGRNRRQLLIGVAALALLASVPAVNAIRGGTAQAAVAQPGDGTSAVTAGASCWGIKQAFPSSPDGTYWLNTAALERPTQFVCDMTTAGGGWVLVGRGRQGWTWAPTGQDSPTTLRTITNGPGAFAPAALSTNTITALLGGTATKDLPDGIRLDRATTSDGSGHQDYRLFPTYKRWTWSFPAGQLLDHVVVDGTSYAGSNTFDTLQPVAGQTTNALADRQGAVRVFTWGWTGHAGQKGFSFGDGIAGSNASTDHLWSSAGESHAIPFTKVWIRPQVANSAAGFTPIPSGGYPAEPKPTQLKSRSELAPWGVVGLDHTNEVSIEPFNTNVLALRTSGDTVFVGGRFTGVQQGPSAAPTAQRYLAAFDLDGQWRSGFRPTLDGRVWDMVVAPDGGLIIAGDFTSVNGAPNTAGIAKLDRTTGQVVAGFKANTTNTSVSSGRAVVRGLSLRGDTVYAAGSFNRYTGHTWNTITVSSAVSFRFTTGEPGSWRPRLTGQAVRVEATQAGDRVLLAGYFNAVNSDPNHGYFAITDAATGNPSAGIGPWQPSTSGTAKYQQAVADLGDNRYLVGGSEHDFQLWDRNRTTLIDSHITKSGGDTQAIEVLGGKIFMGCHCGNWVYQGTNAWPTPSGFRSVEPINLVGAWDPVTFDYDPSFYPSGLKGQRGEGVWSIDQDSRGCLWVGGDLIRGAYSGNAATDWLGGFARFCGEDATPPSTPKTFAANLSGTSVNLSWGASTDAGGTVSYDVYRNDRVIATVFGTTYTDPDVSGSARYTVRATDIRGNRSASPAPIAVNGAAPKIATPLAFGSTWRYRDDGSDQGTAWRAPGFADGSWTSGAGKLGWGTTDNATTLAGRPVTVYYRSSFDVADPAQVKVLSLRSKVLTGSVVYVNGIEVGRYNMGSGAVTSGSTAAGYLTPAQETQIGTILVPGSVLKAGANSIAVEVHNMRSDSSRSWFDLEASTYGSGGETNAPSAPSLTATAATPDVNLSWTPASDDVAIGGYAVARDGQTIAVVGPLASSFVDRAADLGASHTYQVTAFDTYGNTTASNTRTVTPQADPGLLAWGATWKWSFPAGGAPAAWNAVGFDDSTWAAGPAELGFGDNDEKTVISTQPAPRPLTAYFRTTVTVADPSAFATVAADVIRDDGAVLYVNGVEVGRNNLPAGTVTPTTKAVVGIADRTQETTPVAFSIPASAFRAGANTIAVEVHGNDPYTGDLSFDLRLTGRP